LIEAGDHAHIEPVKLGSADVLQLCIGVEWAQDYRLAPTPHLYFQGKQK
jgi:hypothetical protein